MMQILFWADGIPFGKDDIFAAMENNIVFELDAFVGNDPFSVKRGMCHMISS